MPEQFVPPAEDPLPKRFERLGNVFPYDSYERELPGTLGEVVVTDPHDPFVWLSTELSNVREQPSKKGKQLLWLIYRMNGNFPATDQDNKWRDDTENVDDLFKNISQTDQKYIDQYIKHLAHLDAEAAMKDEDLKKARAPFSEEHAASPIELHKPNIDLLAALIQGIDAASGDKEHAA